MAEVGRPKTFGKPLHDRVEEVARLLTPRQPPGLGQVVEEGAGGLQIGGVEAFGEPPEGSGRAGRPQGARSKGTPRTRKVRC